MKKQLITLLLFLPIICFAQKVNVKVDDFTGEKVITTEWEKIYTGGMTGKNQTRVRFRHENNRDYIEFRIFCDEVTSCKKDAKILFKTENGIIETRNIEYALSEPGAWSPSGINKKLGIYLICTGDLSKLGTTTVQKIRITYSDGYEDLELKGKDAKVLKELFAAFKNVNGKSAMDKYK